VYITSINNVEQIQVTMVNVSSILTVTTTKITIMTINEIFNELQLINEFESDFNITSQSKTRREELTNKLQQLMDNNIK
jgi:hypothetical protein